MWHHQECLIFNKHNETSRYFILSYCMYKSKKNLTISIHFTAFLYQRCITYTCVLSPEELADIIIEEIVPVICAQPQGVPVNFICRKLGLLIYNRFASKYKGESGVAEKVCCLSSLLYYYFENLKNILDF